MSKKINVAVVGVGNMGQHHARNYHEMSDVTLVAICDMNIEKGQKLAKQYNCLFYSDYKKMLAEQTLDAVSVAVPTSLHHTVACDILNMKVSVLLEKPIATTLSEARKIIDTAKKNKVKLMIGHIERYNPAVQRVKELIVDGRLGSIVSINIKRVGGLPPQIKDANVIIDLAIHDIDISNYLLDEYPKKVHGFKSKNVISDREDSAVLLLEYPHSSSFIEANWITPVKVRTMDITGTKSFVRVDYINQTVTLYENSYQTKGKNGSFSNFNEFILKSTISDEVKIGINKKEPLRSELEDFISFLSHSKKPLIQNEEAYKALEIAIKI